MEDEQSFRWRSLLQAQSGVVSRQQARHAGWSEKAIDRRLRSGSWQRLQREAYATFSGNPSREAMLWAAVLRAGVTEHRCRTAAEIAAALRRRGWTGTLRPCGPDCTAVKPARKGQEEAG